MEDTQLLAQDLVAITARVYRWLPRADLPVSLAAARLLARLSDTGPQRISELAAAEGSSQPTITNHVQRLEASGLVSRTVDRTDGRAWQIALTPAGREQLGAMKVSIGERVSVQLDQLSESELLALREGLTLMSRIVDNRAGN